MKKAKYQVDDSPRSVAQRSVQTPHKRKTVVRPHPERSFDKASVTLKWPKYDDGSEEDEKQRDDQAEKLSSFLLDVIPAQIAERALNKWLAFYMEDTESNYLLDVLDQEVIEQLKRVLAVR